MAIYNYTGRVVRIKTPAGSFGSATVVAAGGTLYRTNPAIDVGNVGGLGVDAISMKSLSIVDGNGNPATPPTVNPPDIALVNADVAALISGKANYYIPDYGSTAQTDSATGLVYVTRLLTV